MTNAEGMEMEQGLIKALLEAFEQSDWQEMTVTVGGDRLHVSRRSISGDAAPPPLELAAADAGPAARVGPPPQSPAPATAAAEQPAGLTVTSPSVGLFWRAPAPGAPPFVEVGCTVAAGDTVAIVEVMKLMNHVTAPVSGTVKAVLRENGDSVEFGEVLVVIEPEE
ncbi:MAG: acetyl-CoA carboxylase biotin carboxyl carrier protein [Solirubrobacteraceae bacterium]